MQSEKETLLNLLKQYSEFDLAKPSPENEFENDYVVKEQDSHWQIEIFFVLRGTVTYLINNRIYNVTPGHVAILDRWEEHKIIYSEKNRNAVFVKIHFHDLAWWYIGEIIDTHAKNYEWSWISANKDLAIFVEKRLKLWHLLKENKAEGYDTILRKPLAMIFDDYVKEIIDKHTNTGRNINDVIEITKTRIEKNRGKNSSLKQLAEKVDYSTYRLAHMFKEQTGKSIGQYIDDVRIRFMLWGHINGLKQKEIAYELGFKTPNAFHNWARKKNLKQKHLK